MLHSYVKALPKKIRTQWMFLNKPVVRASHKSEQLAFHTAPSSYPLLSPAAVTAEVNCLKGEPCEHLQFHFSPPPVSLCLLFCPSTSANHLKTLFLMRRKLESKLFGGVRKVLLLLVVDQMVNASHVCSMMV